MDELCEAEGACWALAVGSVVAGGGVHVFGNERGARDVEVEQLDVKGLGELHQVFSV